MHQLLDIAGNAVQAAPVMSGTGAMGDAIPSSLDWTNVVSGIADLVGNPFVLLAIVAVFVLRFFPRMLKALFSATRSR